MRQARTTWWSLAVLAVATAAALVWVADRTGGTAEAGAPPVGTWSEASAAWPEDAARLTLLGGTRDALDVGEGPVLVNLWASTCPPCIEEMPILEEVSDAGAVRVVGISLDTIPAEAEDLMERTGVEYANYLDSRGVVPSELAGVAPPGFLPVSFLLEEGEVTGVHIGPFDSADQLAGQLADLTND